MVTSERLKLFQNRLIINQLIKHVDYDELSIIIEHVCKLEAIKELNELLKRNISKIYDETPDPDNDELIIVGEITSRHFGFL